MVPQSVAFTESGQRCIPHSSLQHDEPNSIQRPGTRYENLLLFYAKVNRTGSPGRILPSHTVNQVDDLTGDSWSAFPPRLPSPEQPETKARPADNGLRLHKNQVGAPTFAEALQEDLEDPVPRSEPRSLDTSPKDRKLLAEGQVLQDQRSPAPHQATQNEEDGAQNRHPRLPWVLDLVRNGLRELC